MQSLGAASQRVSYVTLGRAATSLEHQVPTNPIRYRHSKNYANSLFELTNTNNQLWAGFQFWYSVFTFIRLNAITPYITGRLND